MFSLESPHRGDSIENIKHTIFNRKKNLNYLKLCGFLDFSYGLKHEFETAAVNEPSVFEPLKFYCIFFDIIVMYPIPILLPVTYHCPSSPVKLAVFSLNPKQIATKGFFAFLLRTSIPI